MNQRQLFSARIIEKLGAPLVAAVNERTAYDSNEEQAAPQKSAETVAALVNKCIQLSIALAGSIDLRDNDGESDSVRLALACVAAPIVAGHYRATGKVPGENDIKRMIAGIESVLTFSDNFAPEEVNTKRIENINPADIIVDENQANVQYIHALTPAVNAISAFSFGQPEKQMAQDIASKLTDKAQTMSALMIPEAPGDKRAQLSVLSALSSLYAIAHTQEVAKLQSMSEKERTEAASSGSEGPTQALWRRFEEQAEMLRVIVNGALPQSESGTGTTTQPRTRAPENTEHNDARPAEEPPRSPQEQQGAAEETPPQEQESAAASDTEAAANTGGATGKQDTGDENFNPMSFFKPGEKSEDDKDDENDHNES